MRVGVPIINNFLKNKGDIQAMFPTTKRYSNVLDQTNAKVFVVISAKAWIVQVIQWKKKVWISIPQGRCGFSED